MFFHADSEDSGSDWANAQADLSLCWAHVTLLVLSSCGSFKSQNCIYLFLGITFTMAAVDSTCSMSLVGLISPYRTWPWVRASSARAATRTWDC